jgi:hypothetical protein
MLLVELFFCKSNNWDSPEEVIRTEHRVVSLIAQTGKETQIHQSCREVLEWWETGISETKEQQQHK